MSCHHSAQGIEDPLVFALSPGGSLEVKAKFSSYLGSWMLFRNPYHSDFYGYPRVLPDVCPFRKRITAWLSSVVLNHNTPLAPSGPTQLFYL